MARVLLHFPLGVGSLDYWETRVFHHFRWVLVRWAPIGLLGDESVASVALGVGRWAVGLLVCFDYCAILLMDCWFDLIDCQNSFRNVLFR